MNEIPLGIKYIRAVNKICVVFFGGCSLVALVVVVAGFLPGFMRGIGETTNLSSFFIGILVSMLLIGIWLLPIPILIRLNRGLLQFDQRARVGQVILSLIFLLFFPFGTILYGVALYFLLWDRKTKMVFLD